MSNIDFPPELLQKIEAVKASGGFTALNKADLEGVSGGLAEKVGFPINAVAGGSSAGPLSAIVTEMAQSLMARGVQAREIPSIIKSSLKEQGLALAADQEIDLLLRPIIGEMR